MQKSTNLGHDQFCSLKNRLLKLIMKTFDKNNLKIINFKKRKIYLTRNVSLGQRCPHIIAFQPPIVSLTSNSWASKPDTECRPRANLYAPKRYGGRAFIKENALRNTKQYDQVSRLTSGPYFSLLFDAEPFFSLLFKKTALLSLLFQVSCCQIK